MAEREADIDIEFGVIYAATETPPKSDSKDLVDFFSGADMIKRLYGDKVTFKEGVCAHDPFAC